MPFYIIMCLVRTKIIHYSVSIIILCLFRLIIHIAVDPSSDSGAMKRNANGKLNVMSQVWAIIVWWATLWGCLGWERAEYRVQVYVPSIEVVQ